jgi:hypothetical protein
VPVRPRRTGPCVSQPLTADGPVECDVSFAVAKGDPARVLVDEALDADVLVVGMRGHGGFKSLSRTRKAGEVWPPKDFSTASGRARLMLRNRLIGSSPFICAHLLQGRLSR